MGWCSGTDFFDDAVDVAMRYAPHINDAVPPIIANAIVMDLYTSDSFKWSDWDCQDESKYAHILNPIRVILGEIEPPCSECKAYSMYNEKCEGDCYEGG